MVPRSLAGVFLALAAHRDGPLDEITCVRVEIVNGLGDGRAASTTRPVRAVPLPKSRDDRPSDGFRPLAVHGPMGRPLVLCHCTAPVVVLFEVGAQEVARDKLTFGDHGAGFP